MRENQAGDQTVGFDVTVGDAISRAAGGLKRRIVPEGTGVGSVARRERRSRWTILSILFVLGFAASTAMTHAERNAALDGVIEQARDEAQLVAAALDGSQLTKPVKGPSYDKAAAKIWKSVSSEGSIVGVTVWSPEGRVLFSLNQSLVGTTRPQMQSLITGVSQGSGSRRVLNDTVQTFMPVAKATDRAVAIVEVDQPLAVVEARIGDFWSTLRLGSAFGLAVSLLLLGLTFVSSRSVASTPEDDERPEHGEPQEGREGAETKTERQAEDAPTEEPALLFDQDVQAPQPDLDHAVDQDEAPEGDVEFQELMRRRREEFKARAEKAEHRVKNPEAELQEAASATGSEP